MPCPWRRGQCAERAVDRMLLDRQVYSVTVYTAVESSVYSNYTYSYELQSCEDGEVYM